MCNTAALIDNTQDHRWNTDLCIARTDTLKPEEDGKTKMNNDGDVWSPKFSPDGKFLAVGSGRNQVVLYKWGASPSERHIIKKVQGCTRSISG